MIVKDLILYQVSRDRNYKVGDIIEFGIENNGVGNRVFNSKFNICNETYYDLGFKYADSKNFFKKKELIVNICKSLSESDYVIRELAVEEIRKNFYPDMPSRLKCMFLSESKDLVLRNLHDFHKENKNKQYQAVAVKVTGNIFYAKEIGLPRKGLSYSEYMDVAHQYWCQNQDSTSEVKEILFEGNAEIVEIIEELECK